MTSCPSCSARLITLANALLCERCSVAFPLPDGQGREGVPAPSSPPGLPSHLAAPLHRLAAPIPGPSARVEGMLLLAESWLRTATLLLLAEYVTRSDTDAGVSDALTGLRLPQWGEWTRLARALATFLAKDAAGAAFGPVALGYLRLAGAKERERKQWGSLLDGLPGLQGPAANPIDALWKARNVRRHGRGTLTRNDPADAQTAARLQPVVSTFLEHLFPGTAPVRIESDRGERELAAVAGNRRVPLYPLFATSPCAAGTSPELLLLDGVSEDRALFVGSSGTVERADLVGALLSLLKAKGADFSLDSRSTKRWMLVDPARRISRTRLPAKQGTVTGAPPAAAETLRAAVRIPRKAVLLLADPARLATDLLCGLAERGFADEDVAVYLPLHEVALPPAGSARESLGAILLAALGIRTGEFLDAAALFAHLALTSHEDLEPDRKLWFLLDGLDRAAGFDELLPVVDSLLELGARYPWLRVVVAMSQKAYEARRQQNAKLGLHVTGIFSSEHHLARFPGPDGDRPFLLLDRTPADG